MSHENILFGAAVIFGSIYIFATVAYMMFRSYMRLKERQLESDHTRLDDFRAHLEFQLMDLNRKFASSEQRWQEINHLVVAGQNVTQATPFASSKVRPSEFLRSHGIAVDNLDVNQQLIFVLTSFHDELRDEFETVVQVGQELGFTVFRGDEKATKGDIFPQLLHLIASAKIVIANISGRNPNVFYELGIAHALDKPVILLAHSETNIPFDIRSKRIIFYKSNDDLRSQLSKTLARTLLATTS